MSSVKKQSEFFLTHEDEKLFSSTINNLYENVVYLDGQRWGDAPKIVDSIEKCKDNYCYIWNKKLYPTLPSLKLKSGETQGPISGIVIQFASCKINNDGFLLSGRLAVGYNKNSQEFHKFVNKVFNILKKISYTNLYHVPLFGDIKDFRIINDFQIGNCVRNDLISQSINGLKSVNTDNYYIPTDVYYDQRDSK